jgi:FkbM family methyltransferase
MKFKTIQTILQHPLTRNQKAKTLTRFFKRGLVRRLHPFPMIYPFLGNTHLLIGKGMSSAELQVYTGVYEFNDMFFVVHFLREEDTFVDIGANVGVYTVLASGLNKAKTIAVEPDQETFQHLQNNVFLNRAHDKVTALNVGVGEKQELLKFTKGLGAINHVMREEDAEASCVEVLIQPLDAILDGLTPTLIKIDVEGFETQVVKGGMKALASSSLKGVIIELNGLANRYKNEEHFIHTTLLDLGFKPYAYDAFARKLNALDTHGEENTLYLKDVPMIEERLRLAPRHIVLGHSV